MSQAFPPASGTDSSPRAGLTSIVIVAADSGAGLLGCVAAVLASAATIEVIVVDNASSDAAVDAVVSRFAGDSRQRVVRNASHLGFGGGIKPRGPGATGMSVWAPRGGRSRPVTGRGARDSSPVRTAVPSRT